MTTPAISIIIPCYNSGAYLSEALASVKTYSDKTTYEVIIINDGSTDAATIKMLMTLSSEGYEVINRENGGPGAARNTGVKSAKAEYILFLDCDNKIRKEYIDIGISFLDKHKDVGVVYGNPSFFGETTKPRFNTKQFDKFSIFLENYIDMCAVVRKKAWQDVGGIDENRVIIGFEDWDFWIRVYKAGWKLHHINQPMFDYRIAKDSLVMQVNAEKFLQMQRYFYSKHLEWFRLNYKELNFNNNVYKHDQENPLRSFLKFLYKKYISKN